MPWNALSFKRVKWYHMHIALVGYRWCIVVVVVDGRVVGVVVAVDDVVAN